MTGNIEIIIQGLTREWLFERQIVVYTLTSASRDAVDAWIDTGFATMKSWPADRPYLAIHDVSSPNLTMTPYARQRAREIAKQLPPHLTRSAAIVRKDMFGQAIRLFIKLDMLRVHPTLERKVFFTREAAVAWLKEKL